MGSSHQTACQRYLAGGGGHAKLELAKRFSCCQSVGQVADVVVTHCAPWHDEAMILSGWNGAGLISLAQPGGKVTCCQTDGACREHQPVDARGLSEMMLLLQSRGCHNILLRAPGQMVRLLVEAMLLATAGGLRLPVIYHCLGHHCLESLRLMDGLVDMFFCEPHSNLLDRCLGKGMDCGTDHLALQEMHRQVGELVFDARGLACRGVLVRHAVLPYGQARTRRLLEFLARDVSPRTYLMLAPSQGHGVSARRAYGAALRFARKLNLQRSDAHWDVMSAYCPPSGGLP